MVPVPVGARRRRAVPRRGRRRAPHPQRRVDTYRWGPITHSPSLLDGDGGFPRTVEDAWDHADLDEVREECRAQIERAIVWGFDVSHLDSHLGTLQLRAEFFDVYLEMAVDFGLPLRLGAASTSGVAGFPFRRLAAEEGVVFPDHFVTCPPGARRRLERRLFELAAGRHRDLSCIPAIDTDELRAASQPDWSGRVEDHVALAPRPVVPRPRGPRRRDPHRLPRAARPPAR